MKRPVCMFHVIIWNWLREDMHKIFLKWLDHIKGGGGLKSHNRKFNFLFHFLMIASASFLLSFCLSEITGTGIITLGLLTCWFKSCITGMFEFVGWFWTMFGFLLSTTAITPKRKQNIKKNMEKGVYSENYNIHRPFTYCRACVHSLTVRNIEIICT